MDLLWAVIVIILIFFILFSVLPSLMTPPPSQAVVVKPPTPAHPVGPSVQEQRKMEEGRAKALLDMHYQNAREFVPENYPRKPIGACPYSKPPSTDLPMSNVPMCVAVQQDNMHLRTPPLAMSM